MYYGIRFYEDDEVLVVEYNSVTEATKECYAVCGDKDDALELREILQDRIG